MICGNTSDFIDHPLPKRFVSAHAVAILELKKWGGHCGAKKKVGGPTQMSILHGDISLF